MVDEALDPVLETTARYITRENDLNATIKCWNRLFTKDYPITKYKTLEAFKKFRPSGLSMQVF